MNYIAFLRGINVGRNLVKMEDLRQTFASLGYENITTYIQSGNVLFETPNRKIAVITDDIEKALRQLMNAEIGAMVRTVAEVEKVVRDNPFATLHSDDTIKMYVTFLSEKPDNKPTLPLVSKNNDIEVFHTEDREAFSICRRHNGKFGFPNQFIEKQLGMPATTRNWTTVTKVLAHRKTSPKSDN
jgi:uncharacterized protein (DUF1697 family)